MFDLLHSARASRSWSHGHQELSILPKSLLQLVLSLGQDGKNLA